MNERGIMYRFREGENPREVGVGNFQKLASGPESRVMLELWANGYEVIEEVPLAEDGPVTIFSASDRRNGEEGEKFFAVWVRLGPGVPPESRSLSCLFKIVGHAIDNGAKDALLGMSSSAE